MKRKPKQPRFPKYPAKPHRSGQARITVNRHDIYLGTFRSPESYQRYAAELARWEASQGPGGVPDTPVRTIGDLVARFLVHASTHYRKSDGTPKSEAASFRAALLPLVRLYGTRKIEDFRTRDLKALRHALATGSWLSAAERKQRDQAGGKARHYRWSRRNINRNVVRIRTAFRWAEVEELIPAGTFARLQAVRGLEHGSPGVREDEPVLPVPDLDLARTLPHLAWPVRQLVELQLHTGARPGELLGLDLTAIDRSGAVWSATLAVHKTAHLGRRRVLYFGPLAQAILNAVGDRMPPWGVTTTSGYLQAVRRACLAAGVPAWHPYRLRHSAATRLASLFGPETARIVLGHHSLDVLRIYMEDDRQKAIDAIERVG